MQSKKLNKFIITIILSCIIAVFSSCGDAPKSPKATANNKAAIFNIKSFSTAMVAYQARSEDQSYPVEYNGAPDFESDASTYSHISPKDGYYYQYFANSDSRPVSRYCYVAWPVSLDTGSQIYYVDESNSIWEANITTTATSVVALNINSDPMSPVAPRPPARLTFVGATISGNWIKKG